MFMLQDLASVVPTLGLAGIDLLSVSQAYEFHEFTCVFLCFPLS
jgi:hypothetical protein